MENASKALIIAGAVLLSILLISLGIIIYNQASEIALDNDMDEIEIQQFNQKFAQYEGNSVSGRNVRNLIQAIRANNAQSKNQITLIQGAAEKAINDITIDNRARYTVKCTDTDTNGLTDQISIDEN